MQAQTKYSIKYYPDGVQSYKKEGNYIYFTTSETILEVKVKTDRIIRFRYAADGFFQDDFSYAVSKFFQEKLISLELTEKPDCFEIETAFVICVINKSNLKVAIKCNKHGVFYQRPNAHLKGQGCPICGDELQALNRRLTTDEIIKRARQVHGDTYDYSKTVYEKGEIPIKIICVS
jgi:hypothetical protein